MARSKIPTLIEPLQISGEQYMNEISAKLKTIDERYVTFEFDKETVSINLGDAYDGNGFTFAQLLGLAKIINTDRFKTSIESRDIGYCETCSAIVKERIITYKLSDVGKWDINIKDELLSNQ